MKPSETSDDPRAPQHPSVSSTDEAISAGQRLDRICSAAQMAWSGSCDTIRELRSALDIDARVDRNPYGMMVAAVGSGYLLGGGLLSPLTARVMGLGLRLGLRLVAVPFIQQEICGMVGPRRESEPGSNSSNDKT